MQRVVFALTPGVQLDGRHLGKGDQSVDIVDRQIGRARDRPFADLQGQVAMAVLLEKMLAANSIRASDDGQRAPGQPWQSIFGNGLPVFREIELRDPWPKLFIRMAQLDAADDGAWFPWSFRHHNPGRLSGWTADGWDRTLPTARFPDHSTLEGRPFDLGIGDIPDDLFRRPILPQAKIDGVPHPATPRPSSVFDLRHQFRFDPLDRTVERVAGDEEIRRRLRF